ncbi:AtpZ/AtpI family protein [Anaeromicropila populeti]|uniref:Putative F0F1-ATPase subunit Ca2+/Mg2+ transporter n=1 Tax=Anaeromicropila populeti TaxID=37658 RepID=A0A1I6I811_9FIRM|nr:AtpZ/AtpI family protein [Anaeromicropila populeti]SFR62799.1 Putative F0F1-ATPase subunit Ca2+/Mg2+ transporter [Anaeromicropila populeti]
MKKKDREVIHAFLMITQLGLTFITPIGLCSILGYYLDQWMKTGFWFIVMFFVGVLAGFRNAYHLTKGFYTKDLQREKEEQKYWDEFGKSQEVQQQGKVQEKGKKG